VSDQVSHPHKTTDKHNNNNNNVWTFLGVKAAGAWGWQPHHLHVSNVMKSGRLNLLKPSGPHRACYGTPLPFLIIIIMWVLFLIYEHGFW
jgi:hypothetical protein